VVAVVHMVELKVLAELVAVVLVQMVVLTMR
jgi:hypothetical protein